MSVSERETSAAKPRNKVYVIEWLHSPDHWMPVWADQSYQFVCQRKRRYDTEVPSDHFRIRKYFAEEVSDAKPLRDR